MCNISQQRVLELMFRSVLNIFGVFTPPYVAMHLIQDTPVRAELLRSLNRKVIKEYSLQRGLHSSSLSIGI